MRIFHPLRQRPIALLWTGLSLSAIGDQLYTVALTWIAVGVLGSAAGYLSALQAAVVLLAVLGLGRWADAWHQGWAMVGADLARAAALLGVVAAWLVTGGPGLVPLVAAVVVLALGQAVFQPALQVRLPGLSDDVALLPMANGLLDATDRSARLLGPGLVAVLAGVVPLVHFLTLDALSFLVSAAALLAINRLRPVAHNPPPAREAGWRSIVRGARATAAHPLLGFVLRITAVSNGTWYAVYFLALPLLIEHRGLPDGLAAYGFVLSAYGCTNLLATVVFGSRALPRRPQRQMFGGSVLGGVGLLLLALAGLLPAPCVLPGLLAAAAVGAVGGPMKDIPVAVLRQTRLARADIAPAMRAYMAANSAGLLLAMLAAPALLAWFGVVPVILACGAVVLVVGVIGLVRHAGWSEPLSAFPPQ